MNRLVTEGHLAGIDSGGGHEVAGATPVAFELDGQRYWLQPDDPEFAHAPGDFIHARCPSCGSYKVLVDGDLVRDARGDGGAPAMLGAYWALCDDCVHTWNRCHSPDLVAALCKAGVPSARGAGGLQDLDGEPAPTARQDDQW